MILKKFKEKRTYTVISFTASAVAVVSIPYSLSLLIICLEIDAISAMSYSITKNYKTYTQIVTLDRENSEICDKLIHTSRVCAITNLHKEAKEYWHINVALNSLSIIATILHGIFLEVLANDIHDIHDPYVISGTIIGALALLVHGATHVFSAKEKRKILNTLHKEHITLLSEAIDPNCLNQKLCLTITHDNALYAWQQNKNTKFKNKCIESNSNKNILVQYSNTTAEQDLELQQGSHCVLEEHKSYKEIHKKTPSPRLRSKSF